MITATRKHDFLLKKATTHWETNAETSVSECLKRSETLFQMLVSMPRKAFKTASLLVELIFCKINSLQKEAVKKDLFSSRDCVETLWPFALKRFRVWNVLFQTVSFRFKPCCFVSNRDTTSRTEHKVITVWTYGDHDLNVSSLMSARSALKLYSCLSG